MAPPAPSYAGLSPHTPEGLTEEKGSRQRIMCLVLNVLELPYRVAPLRKETPAMARNDALAGIFFAGPKVLTQGGIMRSLKRPEGWRQAALLPPSAHNQ